MRTKTKWRTELSESFACPTPPSMGPTFAGRGQVILLGRLANRLGSRFGTNTELLRGVNWPYVYAAVFDEFSLREGYRNNALPR